MNAQTLNDLHNNWAWVVIIGNALAGIWALAAHKLVSLRTRALWWYTALAQITMFVQVILGVIMVNRDKAVYPAFHAFYGFVGIIAIAIIYSYRAQLKGRGICSTASAASSSWASASEPCSWAKPPNASY